MASDYQIASGHNNAAGLTSYDELPNFTGTKICLRGAALFTLGTRRLRADYSVYNTGIIIAKWSFRLMEAAQYVYLKDTFMEDATNGNQVTIRTLNDDNNFTNYNANIRLPLRSELGYVSDSRRFSQEVMVEFLNLEAL